MELYHPSKQTEFLHGLGAPGPELIKKAEQISRSMAERVLKVNAASWREAAMKSTKARQMYRALMGEIEQSGVADTLYRISRRNAALIRSVPRKVGEEMTAKASELQLAGERPEALSEKLKAIAPHLTRAKIRLIARTEISRAETDITVARAQDIGIEWGQWSTSNDIAVRPSHRLMDKVLMKFSDPPAPEKLAGIRSKLGHYLPGQAPRCRCVLLPLVSLDEITWPAKVYSDGKIVRMSRKNFAKLIAVPPVGKTA